MEVFAADSIYETKTSELHAFSESSGQGDIHDRVKRVVFMTE